MESIELRQIANGTTKLYLRAPWEQGMNEAIQKGGFGGIRLIGEQWDLFSGFSDIAKQVTSLGVESYGSLKGLERFENLTSLGLGIDGAPRTPPDLSAFPKLRTFVGYWHKSYLDALTNLKSLEVMNIYGFASHDCSVVGKVQNLKKLGIVRGGLRTLDGLDACSNLEQLELCYLRNLASIDSVASLKNLRHLWIENAAKIESLEPIFGLKKLQMLYLYNCGSLPRVDWVSKLVGLEKLWIPIPVVNIDWGAVLSPPKLKMLAIRQHSGGSVTNEYICDVAKSLGKTCAEIDRGGTKKSPTYQVMLESSGEST